MSEIALIIEVRSLTLVAQRSPVELPITRKLGIASLTSLGYDNLPPEDYRIRLAPAPRYRPGHPFYKYATIGGSSCGIKERSELDAVLSEWSDIYGASPPADSRLLAHYMTTPPEAPPVKLRRKAGYDAGSAFKRWALRRGKGE